MKDLSKEEIVELLIFYKNKSTELELSYLVLQLNSKKALDEKKKEYEDALYLKDDLIQSEKNSHNATKIFLKEEIQKINNQLKKYKTKNNKEKNNKVTNKKS
jgi:hypothetical protein